MSQKARKENGDNSVTPDTKTEYGVVKEIQYNWILISYDMPCGYGEGDKFREFIQRLGGQMHTQSVYLLPNTNEEIFSQIKAKVPERGLTFLWTPRFADKTQAVDITTRYDKLTQQMFDDSKKILLEMDVTITEANPSEEKAWKKIGGKIKSVEYYLTVVEQACLRRDNEELRLQISGMRALLDKQKTSYRNKGGKGIRV